MARSGSAIVFFILFGLTAACRKDAAKARPVASPVAPIAAAPQPAPPPVAPPPPPAAQPESPPVGAWTDPRVIAELVKDCKFDPDTLTEDQRKPWNKNSYPGSRSALSCKLGFEQSCVYDPCFDKERSDCRPKCAKSCSDCGTQCADACATCKASCHDDACKTACATQCASCRQDCVRVRDRCSTGTCTNQYRQCRKKLKSDWLGNNCPEVCRALMRCQKPCLRKHPDGVDSLDSCDKPCRPKDTHGCNVNFCGGAFGMGIDPLDLG
jgi:hypothetical protein